MTTINTIEDLARILKEQPTWAEALRALILSEDLLALPARFERFIEEQRQVNDEQRQFNEGQQSFNDEQRQFNKGQQSFNDEQRQFNEGQQSFNDEQRQFNKGQHQINEGIIQRLNTIEGRLGNLEGGQFERNVRSKAFARAIVSLGFESAYVAMNQDGLTDPRLTQSIERAIRSGAINRETVVDLYETDLIVSARDNRHLVVEVSITADHSDIQRAKARASILADITNGTAIPAVFTANLSAPQREQAEAENVSVFVVPYP